MPEPVAQTAPQPAATKPAIKAPQPAPSKPADPAVADANAKAKLKSKVVPPEQQLSLHEWRDADQNEVTSREGQVGMASMELFFSDMRALLAAASKESASRLNRTEKAITEDLRLSRDQCSQSQEVAKGLAAKVKALEEELERLRKREAEHQTKLASVKQVEQEKVDGLNHKLGEVDEKCQRLSSEVAKQSTLLMETARTWTEEISRLDHGLAASFPKTQEAALEVAQLAREGRRAAGDEGSPYFSVEDHLAAMQARITPITMLGHELRLAVEEIYRLLWLTKTLPAELGRLVEWLNTAPDWIQDWKESSARSGADMALSFVLSWYEEVSLDRLEFRQAGVEETLIPEVLSRHLTRACAIVGFVNNAEFVSDPNPSPEEEGEEEQAAAPDAELAGTPEAPPAGPPPAGA
ncbi:hypothetical protein ACQ4PT_007282 [Festuca glaucescens]